MTTTAKEIAAKMIAAQQALIDGLLASIASTKSIQELEDVLEQDNATALVYSNASREDQQKINAAIDAHVASLA